MNFTNTQLLTYVEALKPITNISKLEENIRSSLKETEIRKIGYERRMKEFNASTAHLKQSISAKLPAFWDRVHTPFSGTQAISIQGFLWKKCGRFPVRWERRFFIISDCLLSYSDSVENIFDEPKNVSLLFASARPDPSASRPNCFTIQTKERSYTLQALTEWEMNRWLAVIQNNVLTALNSNGYDQGEPLDEETNKYVCADCGAVGAPWCSVNWGVHLCESCCGIHRSLPSQCSRVRSLRLDSIDPYQRTLIDALGSQRANSILEEKCDCKIQPKCQNEERIEFIKKKYIEKAFVDSTPVDINTALNEGDLLAVFKYIAQGNLKKLDVFSVLHMSAINGNPLIFQLLALNVENVDPVDENGLTPLSYAAAYGNTQIIDILLNHGARPEKGNAYNIACKCNKDESIKKLESFKTDQNLETFEIPHKEFTPQKFDVDKYVDQSVVSQRKQMHRTSVTGEKDKLRAALGSIKQKSSMSSIPHISLPPPDT